MSELVGTHLGGGRFVVEAPLGSGGMGSVYVARDTHDGGVRCAIKVLHPRLAHETRHLARFQREAEVVSELQHPHAVRALASGLEPNGTPWIAMELLDGPSLGDVLKREAASRRAARSASRARSCRRWRQRTRSE